MRFHQILARLSRANFRAHYFRSLYFAILCGLPKPSSRCCVFPVLIYSGLPLLVLCALAPSQDLTQKLLSQVQHQEDSSNRRMADPVAVDPQSSLATELTTTQQPKISYKLECFGRSQDYLAHIKPATNRIDCLLLEEDGNLEPLFRQLKQDTIFLPTLILDPAQSHSSRNLGDGHGQRVYHDAVVRISISQLSELEEHIQGAIAQFLRLSTPPIPEPETPTNAVLTLTALSTLSQQQRRLADKLKERLGYLGVYYKRDPANFFRHMPPNEKQEILLRLKTDYRKIILSYFSVRNAQTDAVNQAIDTFVDLAFLSDISVSQVVEIHIELMDEFAKQLKLEGRSDDILQDYRLTLIDIIAHLCEMYRRSVPRAS